MKLMDFGIAQVLDLQRMTVTGQLLGSPAYMAPEIIEGKPLDFRTDVFSVGIMLYLLATGQPALLGQEPARGAAPDHRGQVPRPAHRSGRGVDQALARIIARALARRPDDRYPDVGPLADDLRAYLATRGCATCASSCARYFADPAAYEAALPKRLAAALTAAGATPPGGQAVARKALELWNRVLAFDPEKRGRDGGAAPPGGTRRACGDGRGLVAIAARRRRGRLVSSRRKLRGPRPVRCARAVPTARPPGAARAAARAARRRRRRPSARRRRRSPGPRAPSRRRSGRRVRGAPAPRATPPAAAGAAGEPEPVPTRDVQARADAPERRRVSRRPAAVRLRRRPHEDLRPLGGRAVHRVPEPVRTAAFPNASRSAPSSPLPADSIIARRLKWRPAHLVVTTEPAGARRRRVVVRDPGPQRRHDRCAPRRGDRHPVLRRRRLQQGDRDLRRRRRRLRHRARPRPRRPAPQARRQAQGGAAAECRPSGLVAALAAALLAAADRRDRCPAPPTPREAFDRGRTAFGRAEYARAIEILHPLLYPEVLLDSEGEVVQAHRMLGVAYLFENKPDEARREFRKLLELRPDYRFDPLLDPAAGGRLLQRRGQGGGERRSRRSKRAGASASRRSPQAASARPHALRLPPDDRALRTTLVRGELRPVRRRAVPERPAAQGLALPRRRGRPRRRLGRARSPPTSRSTA